eukprot:gnl/Hemi2/16401_TR5471_c0_g1_i1.p1 gnl/Hemi2/16401_TR5471_c0_g1~~gnl/Hemi2/16401_TR5471_c0_g1_i1.p1  ORF type:complete len:128 (+),score=38.83 gnl/Hemi2/16401_TR5471_c0_g1_i1:101-484(+)
MAETVELFFRRVLERVPGLLGVVVTDRDGAEVIKVYSPSIEDSVEGCFAVTFSVALEQANKMRFGKNTSITAFYNNFVLLHVNDLPLVISLIGQTDANVGMMQSISAEIVQALEPMRAAIIRESDAH